MRPRTTYNRKRRIQDGRDPAELNILAEKLRYGGNPIHKRNPSSFDLPYTNRRRWDGSLCETAGVTRPAQALRLLREGARRGLVSVRTQGGFPQNVWAVTQDGIPLEAQLENREQGSYHGYPMDETDEFREEVLKRWNQQ